MAQHDYVIANGTGAAVRSDLNNALAAIVSQNSGATAPSPTYAYQFWADTTTGLLKLRNSANSAWITLFQLDGEWSTLPVENGTAAAPSIYFKDSGTDTGFYSGGIDQVGISTGGTARLTIDANGNLAVDTNTLYVDAPNNRVGIGTSSPSGVLHTKAATNQFIGEDSATGNIFAIQNTGGATTLNSYLSTTGRAPIIFTQYTTEVARFDASGRLGIGTTNSVGKLTVSTSSADPFSGLSVWSDGYFVVTPGGTTTSGGVGLSFNSSTNLGGISCATPGSAWRELIYTASAHRFALGGSEAARIDNSGRLLVGSSTALTGGDTQYSKLVLQGNTAGATGPAFLAIARGETAATTASAGQTIGRIVFSDSAAGQYATIGCETDAAVGNNDYPSRLVFSTTADGASSPTERMRITNGGELCIGKTQASENVTTGSGFGFASPSNDPFFSIVNAQATAVNANIYLNKRTSGAIVVIQANNGSTSTTVGTISHNGTSTAYNTTSDYRLKENIETVTNSITRLQQLKPSRFNFIADPGKTVDGFIAHEVQAVVPEAITGEKDAVDADGNPIYQGIDQSKLVPLLTAALQEAIGEIESLKARVAALESV